MNEVLIVPVTSKKDEIKDDARVGMGAGVGVGLPKVQVLNKKDAWKSSAAAITTSAVVSLSICKLMGDFLLSSGEVFQICHLDQLLTALETQYWHARLFHGDEALRESLRQRAFVIIQKKTGFCDSSYLLDQEIHSATTMLRTIIDIYLTTSSEKSENSSNTELDIFVTPWISR